MNRTVRKIHSPGDLNTAWDNQAHAYFQKREFLDHLHKYNPCQQRYYELYCNERFVAGAVMYTLRIDLFTFSGIVSPIKMQVIGLPASVASEPLVGDRNEFEYLLSEITDRERGVIAGLNFSENYLPGKAINMRTLPTIILRLDMADMQAYGSSLRHSYRRRYLRIQEKFSGVGSVTTGCSEFSAEHYSLYLQIMKRTKTRLETLSLESFKLLPSRFRLTSYFHEGNMLCWHILCRDEPTLFFYFGGMNYALRDRYQSYHNNLLGIVNSAMEGSYRTIDLGQTAETAKLRLGGVLGERKMFLYHRSSLLLKLFGLFRNMINYRSSHPEHHVFKSDTS